MSAEASVRLGGRVTSVPGVGLPDGIPVYCRLDGEDLKAVAEPAYAGKLGVRVGATFPLERAADAQRLPAAGGTRGKVVVTAGD
ncbi:zinc-binding dehydrogenase [Streptomyces flaveolus]|uniref:zinc-binding dehydrogenase n=1 Tax=Streptomyces flaveolus TaxID=67297 RepID=UPI0034195C1C